MEIKKLDITEEVTGLTLVNTWADNGCYHYELEEHLIETDLFDFIITFKVDAEFDEQITTNNEEGYSIEKSRDFFCEIVKTYTKDGEEILEHEMEVIYQKELVLKSLNLE